MGAATDKFAILALTAGLTQTVPIAPPQTQISTKLTTVCKVGDLKVSPKPFWI